MEETVKLPDYTFKKSTCERYDLRFNKHEWAIFTIDENGGLFNCHSSFGDYTYSWPHHGRKTFKHFILEITRDYWYLLNKVSNETYFNFEKTVTEWKNKIVEWRKDRDISKKQVRDAIEFINGLDSGMSADYTITRLIESDVISDICSDSWEVFDCVKEYPGDAMVFAKTVMPMFADILKKEIAAGEQL